MCLRKIYIRCALVCSSFYLLPRSFDRPPPTQVTHTGIMTPPKLESLPKLIAWASNWQSMAASIELATLKLDPDLEPLGPIDKVVATHLLVVSTIPSI